MVAIEQLQKDVQSRFSFPIRVYDTVGSPATFPETWRPLFGASGQELSDRLTALWEPVASGLPDVVDFVVNSTGQVAAVEAGSKTYLLYVFTDRKKKRWYYFGEPASQGSAPSVASESWALFPPTLQAFYSRVHNGWLTLHSQALGPNPLERLCLLSDPKFDRPPGSDAMLPFQWAKIVVVMSNGGGDYLCLDTGNLDRQGRASGFIFFHEMPDQPERRFDFLSSLNGWMSIGFEHLL